MRIQASPTVACDLLCESVKLKTLHCSSSPSHTRRRLLIGGVTHGPANFAWARTVTMENETMPFQFESDAWRSTRSMKPARPTGRTGLGSTAGDGGEH
jgi:hypothetical protein